MTIYLLEPEYVFCKTLRMFVNSELQIVWFKRDLRVADNHVLALAAQHGPVLPLFIAEPDLWAQTDASARQWEFVRHSLMGLRDELGAIGQPLVVRKGRVLDIFERARRRYGRIRIWSHQETGNGWTYQRDKEVQAWAKAQGIIWTEIRQSGVIRRIKTRNGWAKNWAQFMGTPESLSPKALPAISGVDVGVIPSAADLKLSYGGCKARQQGGRRAGLDTLESFLYVRGAPYMRAMSGPSLGAKHCSRLSPHLAWGTLSSREVTQATWARQRQLKLDGIKGGWRGAMSSFEGRLHWRDHFTQKLEDQPNLEFRNLHRAYDGLRPLVPNTERFAAWCKGETGLPFVDACMRALIATGWMNFRMRAMLMAVASYHLWLDWRATGLHLARMFTDYEPGIHWPQVQMQSGTTGINTIRIYNPIKQGYDQDPNGNLIRKWLPELISVPDAFIHEPWTWDGAGAVLGTLYPMPIINHLAAAKDARQKVWAVRQHKGFRDSAGVILTQHGSRKSGGALRRVRKKKKQDSPQFTLPL